MERVKGRPSVRDRFDLVTADLLLAISTFVYLLEVKFLPLASSLPVIIPLGSSYLGSIRG
ncbi:hypothetical protein HS1genome_1522 [Sulfodiicoccus acidiphilus]|uniref:Uncharacterized protein n=1 Tax=Sulfodiicoccus acidiphilus TaxID=1670455 RepID=A0A348B4N1_9CREN|nr:hypothetical protein HS1genome_1522 [Sulfodiicoccus acidiphilus]